MAYATVEDVASILPDGETIPTEANDRVEINLEEATDLVVGYLELEYTADPDPDDPDELPGDLPAAVRRVVARVALRAFMDIPENPGAVAETNAMGPFSHTINWSKEAQSRDFYLTASDKMRIDRFKVGFTGTAAHTRMAGASGVGWASPGYGYHNG